MDSNTSIQTLPVSNITARLDRRIHKHNDRLDRKGHTTQRDAYQTALHDAKIRDCVVRVTWTGDADVDAIASAVIDATDAAAAANTDDDPDDHPQTESEEDAES